ncbi:PBECR4 domain-containing protein [Lactobacillus amylolyticus]
MNKKVTFYSKNTTITVIASASNFMHLCGLLYSRGSKNFFKDVIDRKVDLSKILVKTDGTTFQKSKVLNSFPELISNNARLTKRGKFLFLDYNQF